MKKIFFSLVFSIQLCMVIGQAGFSQIPANGSASFLNGTWQITGTAGFSANSNTWCAQLKIHPSGMPWVVYSAPSKMNVMNYNGSSWASVGQTNHFGDFSTLAFSSTGTPFVAFRDNPKVSTITYDGTNWGYLGIRGFSGGDNYHSHISMSPSDQPYVVYQDCAHSSKASVMKYDGTSWGYVGTAGFSSGCFNPVIEFSPAGEPWVAYSDGYYGKASVMKFDGSSWVYVGNAGFSAGPMDSISLAFSATGQGYVAFSDGANGWKATVMMFDGSQWVNVGNAGFSAGAAGYTSIAFNPENMPVVGFQDAGNGKKATVMVYDGNQWMNVGQAGFSSDTVSCTTIAFAPNGMLYIAFCDFSYSGKVTVMEYSGYLGVREAQNENFSVYPNPVSDLLTIQFKDLSGSSKTIQIYSPDGKEILKTTSANDVIRLDMSGYSAGIYCIQVIIEGRTASSKFIKL